jgi:hypothetical protein
MPHVTGHPFTYLSPEDIMRFQFNTALTNVQVPGAVVSIDKIDISVSMEMDDQAYNGLVEMVYNQMATLFGVPSMEKPEKPTPEVSEGGGYVVWCLDGGDENALGHYVRATHQEFGTREEAEAYAKTVSSSRYAFTTRAGESPYDTVFPADQDDESPLP